MNEGTADRRHGAVSLARSLAGNVKRYAQRLQRWTIIVRQLRGAGALDQLKLVVSACAAPVTSLRSLRSWQDPVLLFDCRVIVRGIGCFCLRKRTDDLWHVLPWRERKVHGAIRDILGPGDLFVDAGANIGVYTVLASRIVGDAGQVFAIEMIPGTAARLRQHLILNDCRNVTVVEAALSDKAGERVTATVPDAKFGQATIATSGLTGPSSKCEVETTTLDKELAAQNDIRLIKIDLEGAEVRALAGAQSVLGRAGAVIYESHTDSDRLREIFLASGFSLERHGKDVLATRTAAHERS